MPDRNFGFETLCLHAGQIPDAGDRRARGADLPDHVVRVRLGRARGEPVQPADLRQRLHAHLESDHGGVRGAHRRARGRARGAGRRDRPGGGGGRAAHAVSNRATTSSSASTLYGGTYSLFDVNLREARHRHDASSTRTIRRISAAPSRRRPSCCTPRRSAIRSINVLDIEALAAIAHDAGRPADDRQHRALAVPVPAVRLGRGHRRALGDQVHRRARHHHGRRDRRVGQVPAGTTASSPA